MSESTKVSLFEINYGFSPQSQRSGIVSDNKAIHRDSELVEKDLDSPLAIDPRNNTAGTGKTTEMA